MYMNTRPCSDMDMYVEVHVHVHVQVHVFMYLCTYICMYMHMHMDRCKSFCQSYSKDSVAPKNVRGFSGPGPKLWLLGPGAIGQ